MTYDLINIENNNNNLILTIESIPNWVQAAFGVKPAISEWQGGGTVWRNVKTGKRASTTLEIEFSNIEWMHKNGHFNK